MHQTHHQITGIIIKLMPHKAHSGLVEGIHHRSLSSRGFSSSNDDDEDNFISAISDSSLVFINNPTHPSSAAELCLALIDFF